MQQQEDSLSLYWIVQHTVTSNNTRKTSADNENERKGKTNHIYYNNAQVLQLTYITYCANTANIHLSYSIVVVCEDFIFFKVTICFESIFQHMVLVSADTNKSKLRENILKHAFSHKYLKNK